MFLLLAVSTWVNVLFCIISFLVAVFLILLVLVQRGRGGGLTGALGGMGGQSAFGAKAGDTFTRVTMVTAAIWILLCMVSIKLLGTPPSTSDNKRPPAGSSTSDTTGDSDADPDADADPDTDADPDADAGPRCGCGR
jgi:preprotein translocase subunit SecG